MEDEESGQEDKLKKETTKSKETPTSSSSDQLFNDEEANLADVDEDAEIVNNRNYDSESIERAGDRLIFPVVDVEKQLGFTAEKHIEEKFREELPGAAALEDIEKRDAKLLSDISDYEFRDVDKVLFAIIKEYKDEPLRIWKAVEHEDLTPHLKNAHIVGILKCFARYHESVRLIPSLWNWLRAHTSITFSARVYHWVIVGMIASDNGKNAAEELVNMQLRNMTPLHETRQLTTEYFSMKVNQLIEKGDPEPVRKLFRYTRDMQIFVDGAVYNRIVELYIENNLLNQARDVLFKMSTDGQMPEKKYFAQIMGIYAARGDYEEAARVIDDMDACNIHVPRALSDIVHKGLVQSDPEHAAEILEAAEKRAKLKFFNQQLDEAYGH